MRTINTPTNAFHFGEIDPLASDRTDTEYLAMSASRLMNMRQLPQGGVSRRPGLKHKNELGISKEWFYPFIFDSEQQYVVGLKDGFATIRSANFSTLHAQVAAPWDADMIDALRVTQYADTMLIFHKLMPTQILKRTGATSFTLEAMEFESTPDLHELHQPYLQFDQGISLTVSGTVGTVTLTTNTAFWNNDYVGLRVRVRVGTADYRQIEITAVTSGTVATGLVKSSKGAWNIWEKNKEYVSGEEIVNFSKLYRCIESGASSNDGTGPGHASGQLSEGDGATPKWLYLNSGPTFDFWEEPVFSAVRGHPRAGKFIANRLWLGGSDFKPSGVWASQAGAFFNHDLGRGFDADAIAYGVTGDAVSHVKYIIGSQHIQIFTDRSEFFVPQEVGKPVTPESFDPRYQSGYGCSDVEPVQFDGGTLFIDTSGKAVREFLFEDKSVSYQSNDTAILSSHLIKDPVDMAAISGRQDLPAPMAFVINSDGTMAVYTSNKGQNTFGWVEWSTDGKFLQVLRVDKEIYVMVERIIEGQARYFLEALEPEFHMDAALMLTNGTETTTWAGLSHLEGKTVHATSTSPDGIVYLGSTVVAGGSATFSYARDNVQIGLDYTPILTLHKPDFAVSEGSIRGKKRRVAKVAVNVKDSGEFLVDGKEVIVRKASNPTLDPPLLNGLKKFRGLGWSDDGYTTITQSKPLPLTIVSITQEVVF
ncbi:MAG: hypothetical protein JKY34_08785 [Kordiimonadaceae bacterium]|nr:hypothetical protein [Kordiimonadaceae bacterium]